MIHVEEVHGCLYGVRPYALWKGTTQASLATKGEAGTPIQYPSRFRRDHVWNKITISCVKDALASVSPYPSRRDLVKRVAVHMATRTVFGVISRVSQQPASLARFQLQQQRKHTEPRGCIITQRFVWMTSQCGRKGAHGERSVSRVPKPFGADDLSGEPTEHARRRRSKTGPTLPYAREKSPTPWIRKSMAPIYPSSVYRKTKPNSDEGKATHHQHGRVRFGRSFTLFEGESPFQIAHATLHPSSSKGYYPVLSCSANRPAKVGAGERGQTLISTLSKQQGGTPLTSKNSTKLIRSVNSCNAPTRPSSAIVPPIRDISKQMAAELSGKMARPQTAGPGIPSGSHPLSSHSHQGVVVHRGGEPLETEFEEGLDTETGAVQRTEIGAARPGKVSMAVKLPVLMSPDETGDGR